MAIDIGILGGSGLYDLPGLDIKEKRTIETPFGAPSSAVTIAEFEGREVAFLPRHDVGHTINPTNLPVRANIYAMKSLGVKFLITVSAVGSLQEHIAPRTLVIPDQIIDRTKQRVNTFFDDIVVHTGFADPFCPVLSGKLAAAAEAAKAPTTVNGTYICMEGPLFSTRAESNLYRSWGASIIGMTALPEAKLAREAEIAYGMIAVATDYDCWHEEEDDVAVTAVIENLKHGLTHAKETLRKVLPTLDDSDYEASVANDALRYAVITNPDYISRETWGKYGVLLEKYRPSEK